MWAFPIRRWREVLLSYALATTCLGAGPASAAEPQITPPLVLNALSRENRNVSVAATEDGSRFLTVWDGLVGEHRRIVAREAVLGEWLPEMILDTEPASGNHSPAVALDQLANPHVAWLARVGSRDVVYYVARLASQWLDPVPLVPASDERSSADAVSIAVGPDNRPWIAWQGGTGNRINIYCAELSAATGEFIIHRLTPDAINYNLSPSIQFEGNTPIVYWYTAQNADFSLIGARYELEMSEWKVFVPENLDLLPSNRLPLLFQYPPSKLAAVWYDEIALQERVLLGLQHPTQLGAGVIIDHRPRAVNHPVSATYSTGDFVAVWCSTDEATSRPQIFLTYGDQLPVQRDDLRLSDGNSRGFYTSPALAPFHGGVAVTYTSDSTLGGDGSVLFQRVILHP